jgi:hypothetical protein
MAAPQKCGHFLQHTKWESAGIRGRYLRMNEDNQDWPERIGKQVSTVILAGLAAMFAYGYLGHFF